MLPLIGVDIFIGDCMLPIVDEPLPHGVGLPPLAIDMLLPPPPPPPDPPPLNAEYRSSPTSAAPSAASALLLPPPLDYPPSLRAPRARSTARGYATLERTARVRAADRATRPSRSHRACRG